MLYNQSMFTRDETKYLGIFILVVLVCGLLSAITYSMAIQWAQTKSIEYLIEAKKSNNESDSLVLYEKAAFLVANENTYLNAGIAALGLGDSSLAQKYLTRVKTTDGYYQLANTYYNLVKFDLAATNFQLSIDKSPSTAAYFGLGQSRLKTGDLDKARSALETSYSLKSSDDTATLLVLLGSDVKETNVSRETDPANKAILVYNELTRLGYPQSAQKVLDRAVAEGQLNRTSLLMKATEAIAANDWQLAYDYLFKAKTIDPYYPQIYQQLVLVCEKLGKTAEIKQYQGYLGALTI